MNDNVKFMAGIAVTALVQITAVAYLQGGVNTSVSSLTQEFSEMRSEFDNMKTKVYTIKSSTDSNGIVLKRVDGKVSKIEGEVNDYGQRIAILEFAKNGGK
ncbi:hypothetical protein [Vibrio sp. ER1A]|uniref:hypothetical protein n=1 Tax=Vibrio sp. ER1A TaxID=1517681 RepID=UPI0004DD8BA2|nr:hypothetical protein [Vibrio sp. ER1A]KFA99480.1 hypothetical protein HW45_03730 [Vibrio sp. ER1A]